MATPKLVANVRTFLNKDKTKVVDSSSPEAAFLFAGAGRTILASSLEGKEVAEGLFSPEGEATGKTPGASEDGHSEAGSPEAGDGGGEGSGAPSGQPSRKGGSVKIRKAEKEA